MSPRDPRDPTRRHPESTDTVPPAARPIVGGVRVPPMPPPKPPPKPMERPIPTDAEIERAEGARRQSVPEIEPGAKSRWLEDWSPKQIVQALGLLLGSLVTTFAAILGLIGGPEAFREIVTSGEKTRAAIASSEERIKGTIRTELDATLAAERKARDELSARVFVIESRTDWLAGFAAALNKGKPHSSTPTDNFSERPKPIGESGSPPLVVTDTPYPRLAHH